MPDVLTGIARVLDKGIILTGPLIWTVCGQLSQMQQNRLEFILSVGGS